MAVVLLVTNQFVLRRDVTSRANATDATTLAAALAKIPQKSVAVLPLANESGDPKQQYFSDGLSEELISDLTQIDGLKVIGKFSSFKFRDSKDSPMQIGATLGVAHLIQGSVRQQGDRIRVTVGMIRAADGSSIWSHSYDEQLRDVFAIQTEIGQAVAAALKIKLLGNAIVADDKPPSGNVEAYQLLLQGLALVRRFTSADLRQGSVLLKQSLQIDPNYAFAWGVLGNASINLGAYNLTGDARQQAFAQARIALDKQRALEPNSAHTHTDRGYLLTLVDGDPIGALDEYQRAYALEPNNGTTMSFLAAGLQTVGRLPEAVDLYRKAIATDPLRVDFYTSLANLLLALGQLDAAEQVVRKALSVQPDYPQLYSYLTAIDILRGDAAAALRDANQETNAADEAASVAAAMQIGRDRRQADAALRDYIAANGDEQPYLVAELYGLRKQPDPMFEWLSRALTQRDPNLVSSLLSDPMIMAYQYDPRFAALCKQLGLPSPAEPASNSSNRNSGSTSPSISAVAASTS